MFAQKLSALLLTFVMLFLLSNCNGNKETDTLQENSTTVSGEASVSVTENTSQQNADALSGEAHSPSETLSTSAPEVADPSVWTKSEIIDAYKNAAQKSNSTAKSEQTITFEKISVNNEELGGVFDFVKTIMTKLLANNSTETIGITGGYANLVESDVKSAKAYTVGNNTAIELVMNEQTDGAKSDKLSGTVGHAISTVGDISEVTAQLNDLGLPIKISDEHTSIHYTDPVVKVIIGPDGNIIKGTWSYTVEIRLEDYKVGKSNVENTSVVLNNVIKVNGGFGN